MAALTIETREKAILALLFKTGIRKGELHSLDMEDLNQADISIRLKHTPKRSNRIVFFDEESRGALARWLKVRGTRAGPIEPLWLNASNERLSDTGLKKIMRKAGFRAGLHDAAGPLEDRFSAHCCLH
jgi:surface polysaccharide O-acyltransferase-like enzyme